jgi:hypothetical protein
MGKQGRYGRRGGGRWDLLRLYIRGVGGGERWRRRGRWRWRPEVEEKVDVRKFLRQFTL